jgi:hypothetical protein
MRVASIPALFARAEASSMESASLQKRGVSVSEPKQSLTRCDDYSLSDGNIPQNRPHVSFHLRIDSSTELVDEQVRRVPCKPRNI